jgi:3-hydroxyacyl-CoA dehydrogenase / enoyl-CoA hydratase / 3-hydroxybutyryl-CoA epimerase
MGTGWAPFRGGPLRFADHFGISTVVSRLNNLRDHVAPHFEPCALLAEMANHGGSFYPQKQIIPQTESELKP